MSREPSSAADLAAIVRPCRPSRFEVLGVPVSAIDMDDAVAAVEGWIERQRQTYICITGVHGIMECRSRPELRNIHEGAGLVTPDGMPLVWMAWLKGLKAVRRVYGPDLMRILHARPPERAFRHFYFGGGEGVAERLRVRLEEACPGLQVVGTATPPFRPQTEEEEQAVLDQINMARPDIVWIGLSTPKQELWMARHLGRLDVPVMIGVGAAFDFLAGTKRQAPLWMQKTGLEWLFRLLSEPRRLAGRYLRIVPGFLALAALDIAGKALRRAHAGAPSGPGSTGVRHPGISSDG